MSFTMINAYARKTGQSVRINAIKFIQAQTKLLSIRQRVLWGKNYGIPSNKISFAYHHFRNYSTDTNINPPRAWFKLPDVNEWDSIPLTEAKTISDLKRIIKIASSPELDSYAPAKIILKATKKIDDAEQAVRLDARNDLATVLKKFDVEIPPKNIAMVSELFAENIWLFVDVPAADLGKKMKDEELEPEIIETKRWTVNGAIRTKDIDSFYYVDPAENKENQRFLNSIRRSQLLMLMGARASGKSTRLYWLMSQLGKDGYRCFIVSFEGVYVKSEVDFWQSFGGALQHSYKGLRDIRSSSDFLDAFKQDTWKQKIVIFVDEFDKLYNASNEIRDACLETFREIKNNNHLYAIHSIVACGTFSIRHLNSINARISPFNISESLGNPYFSAQQTQHLFDEFAQDEKITIDRDVVDAIYLGANGHPGMICLCGRAIAKNLLVEANTTKNIAYKTWLNFYINELDDNIYAYNTFQKMVDSLLSKHAMDAVNLLRTKFIGFLGDVFIKDFEEKKQADFLTAEGVLLKPNIDGNRYRMASALIDSFIRQFVIPKRYPNAPSTPIPSYYRGGPLDILEILKESLKFFDKELIKRAYLRSYKKSKVPVNGYRNIQVPRESVYDAELLRILKIWLFNLGNYTVTGQWHLHTLVKKEDGKEKEEDRFSDIVIDVDSDTKVVLELLASGDPSFVQDHICKMPEYMNLLSAKEAWVIHFTCEDKYLEHPEWQSDVQLKEGVNMVHIWHNETFTTVRMSARWMEGVIYKQIDNLLLNVWG